MCPSIFICEEEIYWHVQRVRDRLLNPFGFALSIDHHIDLRYSFVSDCAVGALFLLLYP